MSFFEVSKKIYDLLEIFNIWIWIFLKMISHYHTFHVKNLKETNPFQNPFFILETELLI